MQIFHRSANVISRASIYAGIFTLAFALWACVQWQRSPYVTYAGVVRPQPVPFSHQHHVGGLGIDCRYCHIGVERSAFAGMPSTETCMTCHSEVWKDAPVLQPVRDSWATGRPIKWTRVHDLPDYVYFDHSIHFEKGVGCATCHGQVNQMPITRKTQELYMRWCLECHRAPEEFLRPTSEVVDMQYRPPPNQLALGQQLLRTNHVHPAGLTDCSTCHR